MTDLYYLLLRGSWAWLISMFAGIYLLANLAFAGLYLLGGDCIAGARPGHFLDAFFFSVQTISTIGYGVMAPRTDYAELVVTVEAMLGVLGVALATGMTFAKFARPRAKVEFSRNILISPYDGRRCLYFRVLNVRGNDVVEAAIRVAVALDHVTTEGHSLRQLHELKLVRERTPLFRLSWLVIHEIDEHSPLAAVDLEDLYRGRTLFVITLTGLDGTFAQAVHARHIYVPQDVAFDHHFVDLIALLDDGRICFEYDKFHLIRPLTKVELEPQRRAEQDDVLARSDARLLTAELADEERLAES
nr:ion channel [Pseudenhygromyxa sp. WMMC2535]